MKAITARFLPAKEPLVFVFLACASVFTGHAQFPAESPSAETFFNAISDNDAATFSKMLVANTNLVKSLYYGRLPLPVAASLGRSDMVAQLLQHGADINVQNDTLDTSNMRLTALEAAIEYNQPEVCKLLLEAGADPNLQSTMGGGALHYAFEYKRVEMAGWLLDYGADPFLLKDNAYIPVTPLEMDITQSDGRLVPRMLGLDQDNPLGTKSRLKINTPKHHRPSATDAAAIFTDKGSLWLAAAAQRGELEAVQALLTAGAPAKGNAILLEKFAIAESAASRTAGFAAPRWNQLRDLLIQNGVPYDIFAATAAGDLEQARRLESADKKLAVARDQDGQTPLHWAVQNNQPALISFWLQAGASLGATNLAGQTALHIAAAAGLVEPERLLLAAGAPTGIRDTNGLTPLDAAMHAQQTSTIRLLLADGKVAAPAGRGIAETIHEAAAEGNLDALAALTEKTNHLEDRNELGLTPLQVAVEKGHLAAAALLVDKGADVTVRDPDGNTLLNHMLLLKKSWFVADRPPGNWLDRLGSDPRKDTFRKYLTVEENTQGPNPILQTASFLLACGVDPKAANNAGQTPMQLVSGDNILRGIFFFDNDRAELLQLLGASGGNINQADAEGNTPLHLAGQDTTTDRMASLLAGGADINATNSLGQTPLHKFAERIWGWDLNKSGTNEPFQLLVKSGANVNAQDNEGRTPLHVLAATDTSFKKEAVRLLLDAGANPNLRDQDGRTPVHLFLMGKWPWTEAPECIGMLVKAGADLSAKDNAGKTPLHYLAALGPQRPLFFMRGIGDLFIAAKVDLSVRDDGGETPLQIAARTGTRDVQDWLVKAGAK